MTMASDPKNDLWAFREGRKNVSAPSLFRELASSAEAVLEKPADGNLAISALMRAGEFESGLADANSVAQFPAQQLTDALADVLIGDTAALGVLRKLFNEISARELPASIIVSPPEGFAYYALHPQNFVRLAQGVAPASSSAFVIGIRSIGTTLSAIVSATLRKASKRSERITVRPTGHPYERVTQFSAEQLQSIQEWNSTNADFLVVDEGPGRSGSSFLSVAEALTRAGVPAERITLLGSRQADVGQLCAENAQARWGRFHFFWPEPSVYTRFSDHLYIGGGSWRGLLFEDESGWPPCWPQMERLKFLSPDRQAIFKFEGFGRYGEQVLARAELLADSGFACAAEDAGDGMLRYPMLQGQVLEASDISTNLLEHLARYCAFRAAAFRTRDEPRSQLPAMLAFNAWQEFGIEIGSAMDELCTVEPILVDGRMQPHEWIRGADGRAIKVDAYTHGDDHFFPGPTDIAWDLAGIVVDWNLEDTAADFLLTEFRRISGLDRRQVVRTFMVAYTVFRVAYWKMALSTVIASSEEQRVMTIYRRYRALAERQLGTVAVSKRSAHSVTDSVSSLPSSVAT